MIDKKIIRVLNKELKISGEEFMLLYLIYISKQENIEEDVQEYINNNAGKFDYQNILKLLEENKFIENLNKKGDYNLNKLRVTNKFTDKLFVPIDEAWDDVVRAYPKTIQWIQNGRDRVVPSFGNMKIDKLAYQQFINNRKDKHIEFMGVLDHYVLKNGGKAVYKFENFLENYDSIKLMFEEIGNTGIADDFEVG